jgi:hypothetical protein
LAGFLSLCVQRAHHRYARHHDEAAAFLDGGEQATRCNLPMREGRFLLLERGDVVASITQGAQRLTVGERDWLVEFQGPGHRRGHSKGNT